VLTELLNGMREHWIVLLVGAVCSVLLGVIGFVITAPTYSSTRDVLLVPSPRSANPEANTNPIFHLGGSLEAATTVAIEMASQDSVVDALAPEGSGSSYEVTRSANPTAPIIVVDALATSEEGSQLLADEVVAAITADLNRLQRDADAPENTWINTSVISSQGPDPTPTERIRTAILAFLLGAFITLAVLSVLIRRDRREGGSVGADDDALVTAQ